MGFYLFNTFIPYYGFCILVGIGCASCIGFFLCKYLKLDENDFIIICAYLIAFGFFGAKLLYILVSIKIIDFKSAFSSIHSFNNFISSGFVFYGGLLGGMAAFPFVKKVHKINSSGYLKCITPSLGIAHAFGRIGCSLAGCCYGIETKSHFYFSYQESIIAPNNVKLVPVQGIESFFLFILSFICFFLVIKKSKIAVHYLYLFVYSILRFVLEFFRGDSARGIYGFFSTSQIISLLIILGVVFITIYNHHRNIRFLKNREFCP